METMRAILVQRDEETPSALKRHAIHLPCQCGVLQGLNG